MGSREEQPTPHLSSLVVRPTNSGGENGGSDYEPGEVRPDAPSSYSRSDRFDGGYRAHAGSVSPVRHRNADDRYSPDFDHSGGPPRSRGFGRGRGPGRHRHYSPPYGRGREAGMFVGRSYDGPGYGAGQVRGLPRGNPNVQPRDGDWMCTDPLCNNLNFARREYCNKCKRPRYTSAGSPRRGYPGPPPPRRFPGPPINRSPGRFANGYRSPPRGWARDDPRDFRAGGPHARYEGRFAGPPIRRDRPDFADADFRDRNRFERPPALDWGHRDRGRESYLSERKGYERRTPSPPHPPVLSPRGEWDRDIRERSRSPVRGGPPPKDYRRDLYMGRGRDDRRVGRDAY
ncbi:uncharacterized protein LOC132068837 isoform X1 [Lycium ferocissimum]|uniref:uncharacterized protein LOC132068837 isoform X1 n=1 Tax=Lycium ferocissimum TaxID=112874 RepID=UPI002815C26E|nr:uncharacterized protein LOC132068837 isoform X1 [Lycium ferocissimum]